MARRDGFSGLILSFGGSESIRRNFWPLAEMLGGKLALLYNMDLAK
jgi:hypothetical protein